MKREYLTFLLLLLLLSMTAYSRLSEKEPDKTLFERDQFTINLDRLRSSGFPSRTEERITLKPDLYKSESFLEGSTRYLELANKRYLKMLDGIQQEPCSRFNFSLRESLFDDPEAPQFKLPKTISQGNCRCRFHFDSEKYAKKLELEKARDRDFSCNLDNSSLANNGLLTCRISALYDNKEEQTTHTGACQCEIVKTEVEKLLTGRAEEDERFIRALREAYRNSKNNPELGLLEFGLDKENSMTVEVVTGLDNDWFNPESIRVGVNVGSSLNFKVSKTTRFSVIAGQRLGTQDEENPVDTILKEGLKVDNIFALEFGISF